MSVNYKRFNFEISRTTRNGAHWCQSVVLFVKLTVLDAFILIYRVVKNNGAKISCFICRRRESQINEICKYKFVSITSFYVNYQHFKFQNKTVMCMLSCNILFTQHSPGYVVGSNFPWQRNTQLSQTASPKELCSSYERYPYWIFWQVSEH